MLNGGKAIKSNICVWGYIIKKIMMVGRIFFSMFLFFIVIFSIQIAYETLKQNPVKFKYTRVIHFSVTLTGTEDSNIFNVIHKQL